ncbi:MAG: PaaI family thioesterase [Nevskia sp.]|nr:PaaI family thioesterase [Nevskia sp.]
MPADSAATPHYVFKDSWSDNLFIQAQGLEVEEIAVGHVVLHLRSPRPDQRGAGGSPLAINGGLMAYMFDGALGWAIVSAQIPRAEAAGANLADYRQVTMNLDVTFLEAALGNRFEAHGRVIRVGRGTAFAEGEVLDENGRVCATAKGIWRVFWPGTKT